MFARFIGDANRVCDRKIMAEQSAAITAEQLRSFSLFADLSEAEFEAARKAIRVGSHPKGETIISHLDQGKDVFLLLEGQLIANRFSAAGREIGYRRIMPGSHFGELGAFDGEPRSVNIVALTFATIGLIPASTFRHLVENSPIFVDALVGRMAMLIRDLSDKVFEASAGSVRLRLDSELIRMALEVGVEGNRAVVLNPPTHAELAALIGGQRETVTRAFNELVGEGIVTKQGRDIVIEDVETLIERVENI